MQQTPKAKKLQRFIRGLSLLKVPLLGICRPQVIEIDDQKAVVGMPYEFLTKNHLGSMYFGALTMGAELSIALQLLYRMKEDRVPLTFIFKDFSCEFHKRAESVVHFCTDEVAGINQMIETAVANPDRQNGTFAGYAVNPNTKEKIMSYKVTISMKRIEKKK